MGQTTTGFGGDQVPFTGLASGASSTPNRGRFDSEQCSNRPPDREPGERRPPSDAARWGGTGREYKVR
jgi:hypothetical protein